MKNCDEPGDNHVAALLAGGKVELRDLSSTRAMVLAAGMARWWRLLNNLQPATPPEPFDDSRVYGVTPESLMPYITEWRRRHQAGESIDNMKMPGVIPLADRVAGRLNRLAVMLLHPPDLVKNKPLHTFVWDFWRLHRQPTQLRSAAVIQSMHHYPK